MTALIALAALYAAHRTIRRQRARELTLVALDGWPTEISAGTSSTGEWSSQQSPITPNK